MLFLKEIFRKNRFPEKIVDRCIKEFLDKIFLGKRNKNIITVPKKELRICIPYLGTQSLNIKKKLIKVISNYSPHCKINVIFNSSNRLRNFFGFKDKVPTDVRSHLLYRYTCSRCNSVYLGETRRHYLVRSFEHLGVSLKTGKNYSYNPKNSNNSSVLTHVREGGCKDQGKMENFQIIGSASTYLNLCIEESLLIQKYKPKLNVNVKSTPLLLFD